MNEVNVLFIWNVRDELRRYLTEGVNDQPEVNLVFPKDASENGLLALAPQADIVVGWRPTWEFLLAATRMRLFINPGVGVQHHLQNFRELNRTREVTLVNGHGNTYFTAQHAVALLLALTNKVITHHNWMKEGLWRRGDDHAKSIPLRHRKVGLLGYGHVNRNVHRFLSGFDVEFSVCRRSWSHAPETLPTPVTEYTVKQIDKFLDAIDILIVAVPQTDETTAMIGEAELARLGPEGLVVNVGRGDVIEEKALFRALKEQTIAGAALDVWYEYKPEPDSEGRRFPFHYPFNELENVVLSPHRAASPMDDLERWNEVIENIKRFAQGRDDLLNIVDLERGY
ncbi:MAG: NAD(P)-dependent oxidoreductase [Candidatus Thorarchaeota archaeon]